MTYIFESPSGIQKIIHSNQEKDKMRVRKCSPGVSKIRDYISLGFVRSCIEYRSCCRALLTRLWRVVANCRGDGVVDAVFGVVVAACLVSLALFALFLLALGLVFGLAVSGLGAFGIYLLLSQSWQIANRFAGKKRSGGGRRRDGTCGHRSDGA